MKTYYHATPFSNLGSIIDKGLLPGIDGIVYLTEAPLEALRFIALRCFDEDILVVEVWIDEREVEETFDHNYNFFKCRAYGYGAVIDDKHITNMHRYTNKNKKSC